MNKVNMKIDTKSRQKTQMESTNKPCMDDATGAHPIEREQPHGNIDSDFDIVEFLKVLPHNMKPYIPNGKHLYNESGVVLTCDNMHEDFYNYSVINNRMKCKTCSCKRPEKSVIAVADVLFKSKFIFSAAGIMLCREHNVQIMLDDEYKCIIPQVQSQATKSAPIRVFLPPPYRQAEITKTLKKFLRENKDHFNARLQKIASKLITYKVMKDPAPKTKYMLMSLGANNMQIGLDPDVLPDTEAKLLCIENCYFN
jgi:hypothetical protein